jgi:CTP:molybdopterin cytidylyltransferase MocA
MAETVIGVLLAAGAGSRYGSPKILAEGGAWLRAATAALLEGGCSEVLVVVGAAEAQLPAGATAVYNPQWREGMGTSLRAGLNAALATEATLAVVHLVDTPDIGADVVVRLVAAGNDTGLARAFFGERPGHPVLLGRKFWVQAADAAKGDAGARDFLRGRTDVVRVQCEDLATGLDHDHPGA